MLKGVIFSFYFVYYYKDSAELAELLWLGFTVSL